MTTDDQFQKVLNDLKTKNAERVLSIWIPSLSKGVNFKHLTLNQQKSLLTSSIRENLLKLDFSRNILSIIAENIAEPEVDINKLNVIDMISIGIAYRAADISSDYGFYIDDVLHPIDLNEICKKIRTIDYKKVSTPEIITSDGFHVSIQVPTIKVDKQMNDHLHDKYKDLSDDTDSIKNILPDVYICEAAKYINSIDIVSQDDDPENPPITIDFSNFNAVQRLEALDQIPLTVLNRLVSVSDNVQSIESLILDNIINGETVSIELNSAFFT